MGGTVSGVGGGIAISGAVGGGGGAIGDGAVSGDGHAFSPFFKNNLFTYHIWFGSEDIDLSHVSLDIHYFKKYVIYVWSMCLVHTMYLNSLHYSTYLFKFVTVYNSFINVI